MPRKIYQGKRVLRAGGKLALAEDNSYGCCCYVQGRNVCANDWADVWLPIEAVGETGDTWVVVGDDCYKFNRDYPKSKTPGTVLTGYQYTTEGDELCCPGEAPCLLPLGLASSYQLEFDLKARAGSSAGAPCDVFCEGHVSVTLTNPFPDPDHWQAAGSFIACVNDEGGETTLNAPTLVFSGCGWEVTIPDWPGAPLSCFVLARKTTGQNPRGSYPVVQTANGTPGTFECQPDGNTHIQCGSTYADSISNITVS